jgi:hypothetical protein
VRWNPLAPPKITLRCDCGESAAVAYGDRHTCPRCGRVYDTRRIPEAEYRAIEAITRRYRFANWALVAFVAVVILFFATQGQPIQIIAVVPVILIAWFTYVRPLMRRRFRRAIAARPSWELRAEEGEAVGGAAP